MSDLLSIGSSALLAYRTALNTVSNNISNANNAAYTRQRTDLQALPTDGSGPAATGSGVFVQDIQRLSNGFLQNQLQLDDSNYARLNTTQLFTSQLDGALSNASSGLSSALDGFFTAVNGVAADPTSSAARRTLISSLQTLTGRFNALQSQIQGLDQQVSAQTNSAVTEINGLATQLGQLNAAIAKSAGTNGGTASSDLLDQRDQLLRQLSTDIDISTNVNADGSVDVFVANGQSLVLGANVSQLAVQNDGYGRPRDIALRDASGNSTVVTTQISGGVLGGLLDVRTQVLDPAANELGQIALALSQTLNAQQAAGLDQYGQLGSALLSTPTVAVTSNSSNTGAATITATVGSVAQLGDNDYVLSYDGTNWQLTDASSGAVTTLSGAGTAASPLTGNGLEFVVGGAPAAGDRYLIQPTYYAAGELAVTTTDPAKIAAATPVQTSAAVSNTGSGTISAGQILDATDPALLNAVTIQFTSATTYSVNGAGSFAYTQGGDIDIDGWRVQIDGNPAVGDSFTVKSNNGSTSDNGNIRLIAGIANQSLLNGGRDTLASANAALVSQVGNQAAQANTQLAAQTAIRNQDQATRDSLSGVNLDEEAADLQRYQQAYQAAAQVIATANSLFQTLLNAVGG